MIHNKVKFLLCFGLLALLLAAVGLITAPPAYADTLEVDKNNADCNDGTGTPCYRTIQAAVKDATDRDTIHVYPGEYNESVNLSLMPVPGDLSLISVDATGTPMPGMAIVDGESAPAIYTASTFAGTVTIDGFIVTSTGDVGIGVEVNSDVVIRNVTANDTGDVGVFADSETGKVTVTNSHANNNDEAGFFIIAPDVTISASTADENGIEGEELRSGFLIIALDVNISGSSANENAFVGFAIVALGEEVAISGSSAEGNGSGGEWGSGFFIVGFNPFSDGDELPCSNVNISDSHATGNDPSGFFVMAGVVNISGSSANENIFLGFFILADGDVSINPSSADNNGGIGFYILAPGRDVNISDSTANDNGDEGDWDGGFFIGLDIIDEEVLPCKNVIISDSSANGNDSVGFGIFATDNVTITGSSANENEDVGFFILAGGGVTIQKSGIWSNRGDGINLLAADGNLLVHYNNIVNNTDNGLVLESGVSVNAEHNWWGSVDGPEDDSESSECVVDLTTTPPTFNCPSWTAAQLRNAVAENTATLGNKVSDNDVDYCPWLSEQYAPTKRIGTATDTSTACFAPGLGALEGLTAVAEGTLPTAGKPDLGFLHGFFSFYIVGLKPGISQTVVVTITLPSAVPVGTQYWKYHASEGGWIQIPMGSDDGDNVITITLVDGGLGDDDGVSDGVIVDQGGPGQQPPPPGPPIGGVIVPVNRLGLLAPWLGLAGLVVGAVVVGLRRRA